MAERSITWSKPILRPTTASPLIQSRAASRFFLTSLRTSPFRVPSSCSPDFSRQQWCASSFSTSTFFIRNRSGMTRWSKGARRGGPRRDTSLASGLMVLCARAAILDVAPARRDRTGQYDHSGSTDIGAKVPEGAGLGGCGTQTCRSQTGGYCTSDLALGGTLALQAA